MDFSSTQAGCIFPYSLFPSIFLLRQGAFFLIPCFLQFFYLDRVHFSLFFASFNFSTQAECIFPCSLFPSIFLLRQGAFFLIPCFLQFFYLDRVHFSLFFA